MRRRTVIWASVLVGVLIVVGVVAAVSLRGPGEPPYTPPNAYGAFAAGSDGIGDPYYPQDGNGGYDVGHYDLDLRYDPDSDELTGVATITGIATTNLSRFNLDLHGLDVDGVTIDGTAAASYRDDDELILTPVTGIAQGSQFVTRITYGGEPEAYESNDLGVGGFLHTRDGAVAIGEPDSAASWFPANDHPRDKATYTIAIAAPDGLTAIANGVLTAKVASGGFTRWTWTVSKPMAPYLATVIIGKYRVQESVHNGLPVFLATEASLRPEVDRQLAKTPEIVDFLAEQFGPYPFDAIGGTVIGDGRIHFALENQTRPIYAFYFFGPGEDGTSLLVHELAHQWFGDSLSVRDWRDIWLNEGFASYAEWLWDEAHSPFTTQGSFDRLYNSTPETFWAVPPGDPGPSTLFHHAVYQRGAMALHALRVTVGDEAFFAILRSWATQYADQNVTTALFVEHAERVSGKELSQLFQAWLYAPVRPAPLTGTAGRPPSPSGSPSPAAT